MRYVRPYTCTKNRRMPGARVSNESLNSYGYWVKTDGIRTDNYTGLFLWNHNRAFRGIEDEVLPIGKIKGLRKQGADMLIDDPEFDTEDEFAAKCERKYNKGYLNAFSIGIIPLRFSEDPADLKPGQTRATVTECELIEISLTDIPANREAVKLYERNEQGELIQLSESAVPVLPALLSHTSKPDTDMNLTEITAALGLSDAAQPAVVVVEINRLKAEAGKVAALNARIAELEKMQNDLRANQIEAMLSEAINAGKITEAQRPHFAALADVNYDSTKAVLDGMTPMVKLHEFAGGDAGKTNTGKMTHNGKTFAELSRDNPTELAQLKENNFDLFCLLFKSEYGKDYRPTVRQ